MNALAAAGALAVRDLRGVARSRSQLYSSMVTPLLLLVLLGTGVSEGLDPSALPAGDYTAFLVSGVVAMTSVFSSTFSSASYYRDRDSGLLRVLLASPQSPRTIIAGKAAAGVLIGSLQAFVVLLVAAPFVDFAWQYGVAAGIAIALVTVIGLNILLGGIAQVLAGRIRTMQGFHLVMNLALFPALFFSGAFFPIDDLPVWLQVLAYANPLTYAVDALQVVTYAEDNSAQIGLLIDAIVLAPLAVALYALGMTRRPRLTWSGE